MGREFFSNSSPACAVWNAADTQLNAVYRHSFLRSSRARWRKRRPTSLASRVKELGESSSENIRTKDLELAGHSFGENFALAWIDNILPISALANIVLYLRVTGQHVRPRAASTTVFTTRHVLRKEAEEGRQRRLQTSPVCSCIVISYGGTFVRECMNINALRAQGKSLRLATLFGPDIPHVL